MVLSCLVAGLWPFDFRPRNGAGFDGDGLRFSSRGIAFACADGPLFPDGAMTASFDLRPEGPRRAGEVLSVYGPDGLALGIFQWKDRVLVRSGSKAYEAGARDVFRRDGLTRLSVSAGRHGTWIYADGRLAGGASRPVHGLDKARCFTLGNSTDGRQPWTGSVYRLSMYRGEKADAGPTAERPGPFADYIFSGGASAASSLASGGPELSVPAEFTAVEAVVLEPLTGTPGLRVGAADALVNFLGFIPLGFLFYLLPFGGSGLRKAAAAAAAGFALSLFIELAQVFIPGRYSQLTDLALNALGAAFGAVLSSIALRASARLRSFQ